MKKVGTRPFCDATLAPLVEFRLGNESAELTATQAEQIAESLIRAATAARYESAIAELLKEHGQSAIEINEAIAQIRQKIETRRVKQN